MGVCDGTKLCRRVRATCALSEMPIARMTKIAGDAALESIYAGLADQLQPLLAEGESYEKVAMCGNPIRGAVG